MAYLGNLRAHAGVHEGLAKGTATPMSRLTTEQVSRCEGASRRDAPLLLGPGRRPRPRSREVSARCCASRPLRLCLWFRSGPAAALREGCTSCWRWRRSDVDVDGDSGWSRRQRKREEVARGGVLAAERAGERVARSHWTLSGSDWGVTPIAGERPVESVRSRASTFLVVRSCERRSPLGLDSIRAADAAERGHGLSLFGGPGAAWPAAMPLARSASAQRCVQDDGALVAHAFMLQVLRRVAGSLRRRKQKRPVDHRHLAREPRAPRPRAT